MISKKCLEAELKRFPGFIKQAIAKGDLEEALSLKHSMETIEWILTDND